VIEKHFILDKSIGGADADFSMDKEEFSQMISTIRECEKLLGNVDYSMSDKKQKSRQFSRSLYASKEIKKGELFTQDNVKSVRPGYGLHPKYLNDVLGKIANRDISFATPLKIEDKE